MLGLRDFFKRLINSRSNQVRTSSISEYPSSGLKNPTPEESARKFLNCLETSDSLYEIWGCSNWNEFLILAGEESFPGDKKGRISGIDIFLNNYLDEATKFESKTGLKLIRTLHDAMNRINDSMK